MALRAAVVALSSSIAYFLPQFELVVALVGSLGASMLAFVVPALLGLRVLLPHSRRPGADVACYVGLLLFGVVGGGLGTYFALLALVTGRDQC
jgi:hypothetical protein